MNSKSSSEWSDDEYDRNLLGIRSFLKNSPEKGKIGLDKSGSHEYIKIPD